MVTIHGSFFSLLFTTLKGIDNVGPWKRPLHMEPSLLQLLLMDKRSSRWWKIKSSQPCLLLRSYRKNDGHAFTSRGHWHFWTCAAPFQWHTPAALICWAFVFNANKWADREASRGLLPPIDLQSSAVFWSHVTKEQQLLNKSNMLALAAFTILLSANIGPSSVARIDSSSGEFVLKADPSRGIEHMKKASTPVRLIHFR